MSDLICSFMIPSRKRPAKLNACLETIHNTAATRDFECLVRLDDDDKESDEMVAKWSKLETVKFFYGPRYPYSELHKTQHPLSEISQGKWLWVFNDDFELICWGGRNWDDVLREVPTTGYYCQPEVHKLNQNHYRRDRRSCGPCVPKDSWKLAGKVFGAQCDYDIPNGLEAMGWQVWFLAGITIFHNRNSADGIAIEHAI